MYLLSMNTSLKKIIKEELSALSNFDKVTNSFKKLFPEEHQGKVDLINSYVKNYVRQNGFNIKFLSSCSVGFKGVRTNKFIIICSPSQMESLGDFIYTIFHEIRHEEQMSKLKIDNPLTGQLEDFEKLFKEYWKLELDADEFAKKKISELIISLSIPIEVAKKNFKLSPYVENYPSASKMIENQMRLLVSQIRDMKKSGMEYNDIADHPIVKTHLGKLENFF